MQWHLQGIFRELSWVSDPATVIESLVSRVGCYAGLANYSGVNSRQTNVFQLKRYPIGGHHTPLRLELDLCGLRALKSSLRSVLTRQ